MAVTRNIHWFEVERNIPIPTVADWDEKDPLVIKLTFVSLMDVSWEFARDLLFDVAEGKTEVAGQGDVQVSRDDNTAGKMLALRLRSPFGIANMRASMLDILDFVKAVNEQRELLDDEVTVYASIDRLIAKWHGEEI